MGGEQLGQGGCPPSSLMNGNGVPTFKGRGELGLIVQSEGFTVGVELGVQHGFFASEMLTHWTNCTEYHLGESFDSSETSCNLTLIKLLKPIQFNPFSLSSDSPQ